MPFILQLCCVTLPYHNTVSLTAEFCLVTVLPLYKPHPFFLAEKKIQAWRFIAMHSLHCTGALQCTLLSLHCTWFQSLFTKSWHPKNICTCMCCQTMRVCLFFISTFGLVLIVQAPSINWHLCPYIQGDPKKMPHKDFELKSVTEVQFYFSTCVSE